MKYQVMEKLIFSYYRNGNKIMQPSTTLNHICHPFSPALVLDRLSSIGRSFILFRGTASLMRFCNYVFLSCYVVKLFCNEQNVPKKLSSAKKLASLVLSEILKTP